MEQITQALFSFLTAVLTVGVTLVVKALKDYLILKGGEKAVVITEILAKNAVEAVEQISATTEFQSEEKFELAKSMLIKELNKKGVPITHDTLEMYIEAALKASEDAWKK